MGRKTMDHYLNSEQLFLFSLVTEKGSFSKAAKHANVHVSTITRQIDHLEEFVGGKLFIRSTHYLGLTESGQYLYEQSKGILKGMLNTVKEIQYIEESKSGVIRLSCLPTFGKLIIVPTLCKENKKINITLNLTEKLVDPIVERLDLAIRIGEQPDSNLYSKKIGVQTWAICASPKLLSQYSQEQISLFNELPLIDKCSEYNSICWNGLEKSNYASARCDDFHAQLMLAVDGLGFCCLPNWVLASAITDGSLIKVKDDPFGRNDPIYALRPFKKANMKVLLFMENITSSLSAVSTII